VLNIVGETGGIFGDDIVEDILMNIPGHK